jgi:hypothetical protein
MAPQFRVDINFWGCSDELKHEFARPIQSEQILTAFGIGRLSVVWEIIGFLWKWPGFLLGSEGNWR